MSRLMKLRHQRDALARRIEGVLLGHINAGPAGRECFNMYIEYIHNISVLSNQCGNHYVSILDAIGYVSKRFDYLVIVQRYARLCLLIARSEWKHVKNKPSWYHQRYDWLKKNSARRYLWGCYIDHNPTLDGEA